MESNEQLRLNTLNPEPKTSQQVILNRRRLITNGLVALPLLLTHPRAVFANDNIQSVEDKNNTPNSVLPIPRQEEYLIKNLQSYLNPNRQGKIRESQMLTAEDINTLQRKRKVVSDEFGVSFNWDGIEGLVAGFTRLDESIRISRAGPLEYFEQAGVANLSESEFAGLLKPNPKSGYSDFLLPDDKLTEVLHAYIQIPSGDMRYFETVRRSDEVSGIGVIGKSLNNNNFRCSLDRDGLIMMFISSTRVSVTGPMANLRSNLNP